ncbi:MAG: PDZ domain-containing protein, partial [Candidatus Thorarchaeota archaeon]
MSITVKRLFLNSAFSLFILFSASACGQASQSSTAPTPSEIKELLITIDRIKKNYVSPVDNHKLMEDALKGMISGLDPHSSYMNEQEVVEMQQNIQGSFGGLGIEVTLENQLVKVVSPIDDTPAARAGLKSGDLIFKVDNTFIQKMTLMDAVKIMRGEPGTPITLTIRRKGVDKPIVFKLVREVIKIQSIKTKMLEPGYVYIRVSSFQTPTGEALAKAVAENVNADTKGIVLDLRNNPGGLLRSAIAVSGVFLKKDALITYTEGRRADVSEKMLAKPENYL